MKDKEKQIEEMGKDVCGNINTKMCANGTCPKIWDCPYSNTMAEILIEKGYRKIDKGSIVLSKEEYNKKKKHLQNVLELSSFQFENVVKENEKLKEQLKDKKLLTEENYNKLCHLAYFGYDDAYEKGCKETAEKFLQLAYDRCLEKSFIKKVEELAKSLGVEIKE